MDKGGRGKGSDSQGGRGRGRGTGFRAYNTQADTPGAQELQQTQGIPNFTNEQWATLTQFVNSQKSNNSEKLGPRLEDFDWCG
ncbi:unnamed protein product [Brassica oleracea var. botrytis]